MAYRMLGRAVPQADLWSGIARMNTAGRVVAHTHLLTADAIGRGFEAIAVQAREPSWLLGAVHRAGLPAILNTRQSAGSAIGHYLLLVDVDERGVVVNDPDRGPAQALSWAELGALWAPSEGHAEPTGHVLVALGPPEESVPTCPACQRAIPDSIACPRCRAPIRLRPSAAVGCVSPSCKGRMWERLCCPNCDLLWGFGGKSGADTRPAPGGPPPAIAVDKLCGAVDAFVVATLAAPGAAAHPDIGRLVGFLSGLRGRLEEALAAQRLAQDELTARQKEAASAAAAQSAALQAASPKLPEPPAPEPPLDRDVLADRLLERLSR
jgi:hypothetical protein